MRRPDPCVGIVCDRRVLHGHPFHMAGEKYIAAVRDGARAMPLLIPALDPPLTPTEILPSVGGLLFTGSPSNVAPRHYKGIARENTLLDEERDAIALPLLRAALEEGVPALCICRGFQELNVALGGTLHQHLHELDGHSDHRAGKELPIEEQYGPAHDVMLRPGGMLAELAKKAGVGARVKVNSLHSQGIDVLAEALRSEAQAPDGTIEAVSLKQPKGFLLGVQWHPEWKHGQSPLSTAIFAAFGDAVRRYAEWSKERLGARA